MKKSLTIIITMLFITWSGIAFADSNSASQSLSGSQSIAEIKGSEADSAANAGAEVTIEDNSVNTANTPRQHITLIPMPLPNSLPPIYKNGGWDIWDDVFFTQNPVSLQMMDSMRNAMLSQHVTQWCELESEGAEEAPITVLTQMPDKAKFAPGEGQWKVMGVITIKGRPEKNIEEGIFEGLYHAKKEMNAKRVMVLIRTRLETTGKVLSLGTIVGASAIVGHNGSPDGIVAGAAGGSGWGKSTSYVDSRPFIKIIVFN